MSDRAKEIRHALSNAKDVCKALGLEFSKANETSATIKCPWHAEKNPSCGIKRRDDGTLSATCFSCNATGDVLDLIAQVRGIDLTNDFPKVLAEGARIAGLPDERKPEIVATYDYCDELGALLFQKARYEPKDFRLRKPDGVGGWTWKLNGVRRVPYRMHEVLADDGDRPVYIAEGEKDCDALWRRGHVATCNPTGAGKWHEIADVARTMLQGRPVEIIADDDEPGHKHARQVEESLRDVVRSIRVVRCPKHKDISDHFGAGGTLDELVPLEDEAPKEERKADAPPTLGARLRDRLVSVDASWLTEAPPPLEYLVSDTRTGKGALEARGVALLIAAGSSGKGFTSLSLGLSVNTGKPWLGCMKVDRQGPVLFVSAEDSARVHIRYRLHTMARAMGIEKLAHAIDILDVRDLHVPMLTPEGRPGEGFEALCEFIQERGPYALVVPDPISKLAGASIDADNVNANALIGTFEALSMAADGLILGCHHSALRARTSQDASVNASRGATGLTDSARGVMNLTVERLEHGDDDVNAHLGELVTVSLTKANHVRVWEPVVMRRRDDGALLPLDEVDRDTVERAREDNAPSAQRKAAREDERAREHREDAEAAKRIATERPGIITGDLEAAIMAARHCGSGRARAAMAGAGLIGEPVPGRSHARSWRVPC